MEYDIGRNLQMDKIYKLRKLSQFEKIPIFAVTGFTETYIKQEMLERGFTDFLEKPYTAIKLKEMINKHVLRPFSV